MNSGFSRTVKSRKGVLIVWLLMFVLVLVFIYPFRRSLNSSFGHSMITEKLANGFDIEVFADLGPTLKSVLSFFTGGLFFVFLTGFVLNAFLTAGLFGCVRKESRKFSSQEFFRACSKNFWPFLIILFIITGILYFFVGILIGVPLTILSTPGDLSDKSQYLIVLTGIVALFLCLPILLLIGDYSRAWKAAHENVSCLKAIGAGFSLTFSNFWSSYFMMFLLILSQVALGALIIWILPTWKPVTGGGIFLLLIVSQLMIYTRLLLKTWRYASVTSLMEEKENGNVNRSVIASENRDNTDI
jgi:membrane protein YdbS with pleckstrin-like domain